MDWFCVAVGIGLCLWVFCGLVIWPSDPDPGTEWDDDDF